MWQGNDLHNQGRFSDALQKYLLARKNLKAIPFSKGISLLLTCSLNVMACYLKTMQYDECVKEGSEVLEYDVKNVKALYRRGQAYKELGQLEDAVSDLSKALEVSPDNETIADALRSSQNFISNADPSTLAALNPGSSGEISADTDKTAPQMVSKMSPEELQRMVGLASSFQGGSSDANFNSFKPGSVPNVTPDMHKTATYMMSKMPPEEPQKMFEMASSMKGNESLKRQAAVNANGPSLGSGSKYTSDREISEVNGTNVVGETSSRGIFSDSRTAPPQSSFPSSAADLQDQMRNQMKDPAMRQEDAAKAQQAMSSSSPEDLDKMMRCADRIQRGAEGVKKTKNWLPGRPVIALFVLLRIDDTGTVKVDLGLAVNMPEGKSSQGRDPYDDGIEHMT
ncbi:hypothetical protein FNV43_RR25476 [Rhamnella rubrinervis]|uniref:Uncharacterized protein n=1 Tax=Rhamnella rubrinervis TaxID=2594499 RepID=A0A8K0DUB2_9ROSA|nr:hypothetical protein FNV43_RR25476 [Rhamnella rubrinervis]